VKRGWGIAIAATAVLTACAVWSSPDRSLVLQPVVLCEDAGWCWFQDERALVLDDDTVVFGSVANGRGDASRKGDVQITQWQLSSGEARTCELFDRFERDDHDAPALWLRPDGRVVAAFAGHGKDDLLHVRVSERPRDATSFLPLVSTRIAMQRGRGVTYANLHELGGALVCLSRAEDWNPTVLVASDHDGRDFRNAGRLLAGEGRPYVKYASRAGTLHFVVTEQHPRDFDNGLYHGTTDGTGDVCASTGEVLGSWGTVGPQQCTRVFAGGPDAVAWPCDLELDAAGRPVVVFSVQVDGRDVPRGQGGLDHRYWYARFDGQRFVAHEIAFAGTRLYAGEDDYTGLVCMCPDDPDVVFLSTDAHPATGTPLVSAADGRRHRELFVGRTRDSGATFLWEAVTRDSTVDNLRPIVPRWRSDRCALLWLRGVLRTYTDYDLEAVGAIVSLRR
jgi:hypothetical protein